MTGGPKPITRQRSEWRLLDHALAGFLEEMGALGCNCLARNVNDGQLRACVAIEPGLGWHLSISFVDHKGRARRYPTWDEITHARQQLLPADLAFVMHLPVADEYVAVHDTTFHLRQHPAPDEEAA